MDRLRVGNRRRRPQRLRADKGYDSLAFRQTLRQRGIKPAVNHREFAHRYQPERLWNDQAEIRYGRCRWKIERTIACLDQNRRLNFLYERTRLVYEGFLTVAMIKCYLKTLAKCRQ